MVRSGEIHLLTLKFQYRIVPIFQTNSLRKPTAGVTVATLRMRRWLHTQHHHQVQTSVSYVNNEQMNYKKVHTMPAGIHVNETAKDSFPKTRVVAYKVCWQPIIEDGTCYDADTTTVFLIELFMMELVLYLFLLVVEIPDQIPCTFRLLRAQRLPPWANTSCASISNVIQGDILAAILSNYMVDIDWLVPACPALLIIVMQWLDQLHLFLNIILAMVRRSGGHMKLRSVLQERTFDEEFKKSPFVYQFSSLGSLDEKWMVEWASSMSAGLSEDNAPMLCHI